MTVSVQVAPAARVPVQVVVSANSPVGTMLLIVRLAVVLVFFSVTVLAALVVPTGCALNASEAGVRVTVWAREIGAAAITNKNNDRKMDRRSPAQGEKMRFTKASTENSAAWVRRDNAYDRVAEYVLGLVTASR